MNQGSTIRPSASPPAIRRAVHAWRPSPTRRPHAFTLLELVLVLAIFAVLSGVAVLRFSSALTNYRADAAAGRVAADIALTQSRARAASTSRSIQFAPVTNTYAVGQEASIANANSPYLVTLSNEPYRARLIDASFAGSQLLTFDGYGQPSSAGVVHVGVGSAIRTISVNATTGQASVSN